MITSQHELKLKIFFMLQCSSFLLIYQLSLVIIIHSNPMCFLYWQKDHLVPSGGCSKYEGSSSPAPSSSRVTMTSVILSITVAVLLTAVIGGGFMYFNLLQRVHQLENRVCCFLWDWYTTSGFSAAFHQKLLKWSRIWHYKLKAAISSSMKKRSRSKHQKEIKKAYVWEKVTNPQSWTQ